MTRPYGPRTRPANKGSRPVHPAGQPAGAGPGRRTLLAASLLAPSTFLSCRASAQTPRPVTVLVLGDSLSAGYGLAQADGFQAVLAREVAKHRPGVTFSDAAVSGDTTAGGRARLDWALATPADAAIVELGGNDGLRGLPPEGTRTNLSAILDELARRNMPVLLSGMYAPPNLGPDYGRQFRAVFDDLGRRPGVIYDPFFLEGVAGEAALNQPDRIHPGPEGVRRIVARLLPLVLELVGRVSA